MTTVLVAVGGALGAAVRYRLGIAVGARAFPWATLAVNLVGTFALAALLAGSLSTRLGATGTALVGAGVLGGFTTFSAFGYETLTMLRDGRAPAAAAYVAVSVLGGLAVAAAGYAAGRAL